LAAFSDAVTEQEEQSPDDVDPDAAVSYEEFVVRRVQGLPFEDVCAKHPKFKQGLEKNPEVAKKIRTAWGDDAKLKDFLLDCAKKNKFGPMDLDHKEVAQLISHMKKKGVAFDAGLSDQEVAAVEKRYFNGGRFPPDLRAFLQAALPVSHQERTFPNWRDPEAVRRYMGPEDQDHGDIVEEILFDIAENGVWCDSWGERPLHSSELGLRYDPHLQRDVSYYDMMREHAPVSYAHRTMLHNRWKNLKTIGKTIEKGQEQVRELIRLAPRLVPVCGRRFMATEPHSCGQPVLSIFMGTDIIVYGNDLAHFLAEEFGFPQVRPPPAQPQVVCPFWNELVMNNEERMPIF